MTECMWPKETANAAGLRHLTLDIQRVTDSWEGALNMPCDEVAKVGKLRDLIAAQSALSAKTYRELVALVTNQPIDPKTGTQQG